MVGANPRGHVTAGRGSQRQLRRPIPMPTVLLVAHHYPPHVGGLEVVVERQARSLVASGYEVIVLTSRCPEECVDPGLPGVQVIRVACWHIFEKRFFIPFPL